jgi:purine-binding chemotaxis protein CheW
MEFGSGQYATFFVADLLFGIDVLKVQEVLREQDITRVPLAPGVIHGLINLRGQIVTAIDMRRRLNLPARDPTLASMNMVVRTEEGAASLVVDEIGDVVEVTPSTYEQCPDNLAPAVRQLVCGIHKLSGNLLLVLDTAKALDLVLEAALV